MPFPFVNKKENFISIRDACYLCDILNLDIIAFKRWLVVSEIQYFRKEAIYRTGPVYLHQSLLYCFCSVKETLEQEMKKFNVGLKSSFS